MLYVVTACHNRKAITIKLVKALQKQNYKTWTLLLVDDGSDDGTDNAVREILPDSIILRGDGNLWWGGALHFAYQWLIQNANPDDAVFFCNDDICFTESFLSTGMEHLLENADCIIVGNGYSKHTCNRLDGALQMDIRRDNYELLPPNSTGNMASTRTAFMTMNGLRITGGFHPVLIPHYGSDYEFTLRASRKGLTIRAFDDLNYEMDETTTGNKSRKQMTLKKLFSKKSQYNPIYRINYFLLTTPVYYMPSRFYSRLKRTILRWCQGKM